MVRAALATYTLSLLLCLISADLIKQLENSHLLLFLFFCQFHFVVPREMCKSGLDIIKGVSQLLQGIVVVVFLIIIIEVNEICIVVFMLLPLRAIMSEMSLLPTLEAGIASCTLRWSLCVGHVSPSHTSPPTPPIVWGSG